jgi:hypothetical protein
MKEIYYLDNTNDSPSKGKLKSLSTKVLITTILIDRLVGIAQTN